MVGADTFRLFCYSKSLYNIPALSRYSSRSSLKNNSASGLCSVEFQFSILVIILYSSIANPKDFHYIFCFIKRLCKITALIQWLYHSRLVIYRNYNIFYNFIQYQHIKNRVKYILLYPILSNCYPTLLFLYFNTKIYKYQH